MCIADTSTMPSVTPLFRTISSTCGVICTYARCVLVCNFKYSVRTFIFLPRDHFLPILPKPNGRLGSLPSLCLLHFQVTGKSDYAANNKSCVEVPLRRVQA